MITGYAQVGQIDKALKIFEEMGERSIVSWNSLITGFVQNGLYLDALKSIVMMGQEGKRPDESTFACGLSACANLAALHVGKQLHQLVVKGVQPRTAELCSVLKSLTTEMRNTSYFLTPYD
ncbi:pentatricopeptide repeat-containing protein [Prunus yedoensis var. nudiflora]|uniref:Pentatricopeptide repeat-containing protein n=1 Tax=Prunus yedoensis var. nudiflora TaxID=2094558 RepID=A0A314YKR4_PRUYE|nr:pentatricopeptide repeat-containing protein [Prunus yedoensis var. nudiflora]